jgi:hypothetical protein
MMTKKSKLLGLGLIALWAVGCSLIPSVGLTETTASAVPTATDSVVGWFRPENIMRFGWLSIFLVLMFKQLRQPIVTLWTAIFGALAIPFVEVRRRYNSFQESQ